MTVALIGPSEDRELRAVATELDARGTEWAVWDTDHWPGEVPLSFDVASGIRTTVSEPIQPDSLSAVYVRRIGFDLRNSDFADELDTRPYSLVNQLTEYRGLLGSVLRYLDDRGIPIVNAPQTMAVHRLKPYQLARFADAGLPVPKTLTTNDPTAAMEFVEEVDEVIYKPVAGGGHARIVTAEDLEPDRLERLSNAPVQFQRRLDGTNYRLFVVDGDIVATAHILSDNLDYRMGPHEVETIDPPAPVAAAASRAADCLGLAFAGVDIIVTEDSFRILEANPSPMFATFDERAGTNVAGHLAEFLE
ncbi:ATP-grasp domain-containing protein [Halocatena salina]|uniref:ATP-grasp domain-containing protein n=1 Tax=Halocatena salina TaxID=2934340 RepID=A0A8U0AB27_9EURY|nr:ATP-grasp domain-containing protein [Halocatena salina]UPM45103.1 ATP-grasp domain-containing protein [Halocatena salina]